MASPGERRPATAEEFKVLGHPLRLQILRLCLYRSLTNQQLAAALGADPATVLYHVRRLVRAGLLVAEDPVPGPRGPRMQPYRATGRSWNLTAEHASDSQVHRNQLAMIDALRAEIATGPGPADHLVRLGLRLDDAAATELHDRIWAIVDEFADRPPDRDGTDHGLFVVLHRQQSSDR